MKLFNMFLIVILSSTIYAQQRNVEFYKNSFVTDQNTTAIINLTNTSIIIESSIDDQMHLNYIIEFDGFSEDEIKERLSEINVKATQYDNHISLTAVSESQIPNSLIRFNSDRGISLNDTSTWTKRDTIIRKSKDSLLKIIRQGTNPYFQNPLKHFKAINKDGGLDDIKESEIDIIKNLFIIKIPPTLKFNINAKDASIYILNDLANEISISQKGGALKAKKISNPYNKIKVSDATFEVEMLQGGDYEFVHINNAKIGSINDIKIISEFSKIEIGEIQEKVAVTDFNSTYWFYNWSENFRRFDLFSEYSKIHYFFPKSDYSFKAFGNNTVNYVGDITINMQPTKNGEKYNMMGRKASGNGQFSGAIHFDIIHGIIYSYEDEVIKINK